ncbi:hypothetical protein KUTeg_017538 [Tegillarca granosa]|uniref:NFX1-type zinc finger-containing protein 1 n=1 Tax=Tegillarca granosa TaxID=220873 RepID=A0ABQ9EK97_TEGGR|nr:hypothetical protein KUTeg_017538 [Tegillarca granosa]
MACSKLISEFTTEELYCCSETYQTNEEVLDYLVTQSDRVEATCNKNDMSTKLCKYFLCVLSKALKCQIRSSKVVLILSCIRESRLLQTHIIESLKDLTKTNSQTELLQILTCTICILDELLLRMPRSFPQNLGLIVFITNVAENYGHSQEQVYEWSQFDEIHNKAKTLRNAAILELSKPTVNKDGDHNKFKPPPNNFREIPVLPCISDIFPTSELYLRPIISKGSYQNLDHYLDVQFRLYREDCLSPLREGIAEYISQKESGKKEVHRLQDVRLYKNVRITNKEITLDGLVYWVELDPRHSARIRWESSNRLIYGSLVCLSSNDFNSLLFAIVMESDRDMLQKNGLLKVQFSSLLQIPGNLSRMSFTMVETTSYFEAYRHVLASLQKIQKGDLPFEKYIVHCKKDISPPFYLRGETIFYDLLPVISNTKISLSNISSRDRYVRGKMNLNSKQKHVDVLNGDWPSAEDLRLDKSQYDAFKSALTKEFVLIQGPPGTGKTHVGLQVVKTLLHNPRERTRPLLIVCFTNHALDQFMEGIIEFISECDAYEHIVRVGGRCSNETIKQFTLKQKRRRFANYRSLYSKLKTLQEGISKKKWRLRMSKEVVIGTKLKDCVEEEFKNLFDADEENGQGKTRFLPLYNWLGVTKQNWITASSRKYENLKQQLNIQHQQITQLSESETLDIVDESTESKDAIDVKTDADITKEDRQIEEEELVVKTEFNEDLGLNLNVQLNQILESNEYGFELLQIISMCACDSLKELTKEDYMLDHEVKRAVKSTIWKMPYIKRWKLYRYWLKKYKQNTEADLTFEELEFKTTVEEYKRERALEDQRILEQSSVIAITTTGAARYQDVLRNVGPKIILVEEAAEVLEAHIVSTLSPRCEHLILIGDHKQLEPKPAVFELARKYNLSLSMFERMIKNDLSYHCLQRQHRMRPEISKMIKHIYPILQDNENVLEYDHIRGVKNDVFFLNHRYNETFNDDSRTYSNQYEAEFIPKLCCYLMKQGYKPSQITVLAAYSGQMFSIRKLMPKSQFEGLRVCVLDNYQGEENDIIILSLVRNNTSDIVGFLKRENRTCVALSRAKKGLYILGNLGMLQRSSPLWDKVCHDLHQMNAVGEELQLYCQNHPGDNEILAKNPHDFERAPDGGCERKCDFRYPCGHACKFYCHPVDTKHINEFKCVKQCPLVCENLHPCPKKCHYPTSCDCQVKIIKLLTCGHDAKMKCYKDPNLHNCKIEVDVTYPKCKHKTRMECWKSVKLDIFKCSKEVTVKHSRCQHDILVPCYESENTTMLSIISCKVKCNKLCENDHRCEKVCHHPYSCHCHIQMTKILKCGHSAKIPCNKDPNGHLCTEMVQATYPECKHEVTIECWKSEKLNVYKCRERVTVTHPKCDHAIEMECCDSKDTQLIRWKICKAKCSKVCANGHCCQKTCHFSIPCSCEEHVEKVVPACGHIQIMPCFKNPQSFKCLEVVSKKVPVCGHNQEMPCNLDPMLHNCKTIVEKYCSNNHSMMLKCCAPQTVIDRLCKELVKKKLQNCEHKVTLPCNKDVNVYKCTQMIDIKHKICGHCVKVQCSNNPERVPNKYGLTKIDRYMGLRLGCLSEYPICTTKIQISCSKGHVREILCSEQKVSKCSHQCGELLPCGHECSGTCAKCEENKSHDVCLSNVVKKCNAGHTTQVKCFKLSTFLCKVKCNTVLACGHKCTKTCNECMHGMMHQPCTQVCNEKQFCGHSCFRSACGTCQPCSIKCHTRCGHGSFMTSCSAVFHLCKKECPWTCSHIKCTRLCYEPCDREPCNKPCQRRLHCGHKCVGYCGEPCPRICRMCDKQQFEQLRRHLPRNREVFVVSLPDCGHEFNSVYIDRHISGGIGDANNVLLGLVKCPTCQKIIQWHPRYGNKIKKHRNLLMTIKQHLLQHYKEFPLKLIDESMFYLKEFDMFCSRLYDTDDTGIEYLLSDVMPEVDVLLSNLESIHSNRKISCQQILDIRCCMITIAIIWLIQVFLLDTKNESNEDCLEDENHRHVPDWKRTLRTIIASSDRFIDFDEGRHAWSTAFDNSKTCKQCGEDVINVVGCGDFDIHGEQILTGISDLEYVNEQKGTKFKDILNSNQIERDVDIDIRKQRHIGRQRGRGRGRVHKSEQENWRQRNSQMHFNGDRTTTKAFGITRDLDFNSKQGENPNNYASSRPLSKNQQRTKDRGRPKGSVQQSNNDTTAVKRTEKSNEGQLQGQGNRGSGENQQNENADTVRNSFTGQRGRGRQFRGGGRGRGRGRGRGKLNS